MALAYTKDERGRRLFEVGGRKFRAVWMSLGHEWYVSELGPDDTPVKRWERKNWQAVESLIEMVARLSSRCVEIQRDDSPTGGGICERRCTLAQGHDGTHVFSGWHLA